MPKNSISKEEIPPIYVSDPAWDDMGAILDRLGIDHSSVRDTDLSQESEGIVMLNCSFSWGDEVNKVALEEFVNRGNTLMASDLTAPVIRQFTDREANFRSGGWGNSVQATVVDQELAELLGKDQLVLDFDTAIKEPTRLPEGAKPLLRATDRDSVIAYKFSHGAGNVVYTAFHNHSQPSEIEDALLQVLLMVPIAESTNTTVTETYTTIVGTDEQREETSLLDSETDKTTQLYERTGDHTESRIEAEHGRTGDNTDSGVENSESITVRLTMDAGEEGSVTKTLSAGESVRLGRDDFSEVASEEDRQYLSRQHIELRNEKETAGEFVTVRDVGSENGTRIEERGISQGDVYKIDPGTTLTLANRVSFTVRYE